MLSYCCPMRVRGLLRSPRNPSHLLSVGVHVVCDVDPVVCALAWLTVCHVLRDSGMLVVPVPFSNDGSALSDM